MLEFLPFELRWVDLLDILLISFFIYQLLLWFRGTVGMQLLRGILVLLGFYIFAKHFGLYTLNLLLEKFVTVILVVIVVVFQPEMRRTLERIGRGHFWLKFAMPSEDRGRPAVKKIVATVEALSQNKIGGLIVVERNMGLTEYVETGVPIDAPLSAELILSIFLPRSPLHDGAVIVRGDRILGAACLLPLSESRMIDKRLGTRHRAAVGMSEISDALIIVVSDRKGIVSVADGGYLIRFMTKELLEERLFEIYKPPLAKTDPFSWFRRKNQKKKENSPAEDGPKLAAKLGG